MVVDADSTVRYVSPSVHGVFGYDTTDLEGTKLTALIHPDDKAPVLQFLTARAARRRNTTTLIESRMRHRDDFWLHIETLPDRPDARPERQGIVLNSGRLGAEGLRGAARPPGVPRLDRGLANRALFRDRVEHALERQTRDDQPISVLFMDLDDFKTIDDSLGHAAGDRLLAEVGERLRVVPPGTGHGGPVRRRRVRDPAGGRRRRRRPADVAVRIISALDGPFLLEGKEVFVREHRHRPPGRAAR